ncbi:2-hydroxycyclohexanecarboxyl-CoA dehydrogenase [Myxococcaceae bacterium]|nr:2-hydroxycyclohexanecarboxyl-CoA dehydrogenase [Myxococcaceae bacterium]
MTGGAGGIGAAVVRRLAGAGLRVAVADLDEASCERLARELGPGEGFGVALDVTSPRSVSLGVAAAERALGPIDVLVNCAGWDELRPFVESDEPFRARVLEVNLAGPIRVTHAVLGGMIERRFGRVVQIASDAGRVGSSLEAVYSAAKGGLIAFAKTIAREAARSGVTSNAVCPGPTRTPMLEAMARADERGKKIVEGLSRAIPLGRLGTPEDVAAAVGYLASDEADFVTGQTLSVSGGLTMA